MPAPYRCHWRRARFAIAAGQLRLVNTVVRAERADLAVGGSYDLTGGTIDARLVMTGPAIDGVPEGTRPEVAIAVRGPLGEARRTLDVISFTNLLALRLIEEKSKKIDALEAGRALEVERALEAEREMPAPEAPVALPAPVTPPESPPQLVAPPSIVAPAPEPPQAPPTGVRPATPRPPAARPPAAQTPTDIRPPPAARTQPSTAGDGIPLLAGEATRPVASAPTAAMRSSPAAARVRP